MQWRLRSPSETTVTSVEALSGGNVLTAELIGPAFNQVVTAIGVRSRPAKVVADSVVKAFRRLRTTDVPVCEHLADQLLIPMALAGGGRFLTLHPTRHLTTNATVIEAFLPVSITTTQTGKGRWEVAVTPR